MGFEVYCAVAVPFAEINHFLMRDTTVALGDRRLCKVSATRPTLKSQAVALVVLAFG